MHLCTYIYVCIWLYGRGRVSTPLIFYYLAKACALRVGVKSKVGLCKLNAHIRDPRNRYSTLCDEVRMIAHRTIPNLDCSWWWKILQVKLYILKKNASLRSEWLLFCIDTCYINYKHTVLIYFEDAYGLSHLQGKYDLTVYFLHPTDNCFL